MSSWTCLLCGVAIPGHRQQAAHMRNYNLRANNPRRCDNILRNRILGQPIVTQPVVVQPQPQPVPRAPGTVATIRLPTRRPTRSDSEGLYLEIYPPARTTPVSTQFVPMDFVAVQRAWKRFNHSKIFHLKPAESHVLQPYESHVS